MSHNETIFELKKSRLVFLRNRTVLIFVFVLCLSFVCSAAVFAAPQSQEQGFVEYETEASINFNEVIEVTLTDKETGYYYTHSLYRANNYIANKSLPLGTYLISAKVISDTNEDVGGYVVVCPEHEIVVENTRSAVLIPLRVEIFSGVETTDDDYSEDLDITDETTAQPTSNSKESVGEETDKPSLLISTLLFLGLIIVVTIVYLLFRHRLNNRK